MGKTSSSVSKTYKICELIIEYADKHGIEGQIALQSRIAKKLTAEGMPSAPDTIFRYIQLLCAVLGERNPLRAYRRVYEKLLREKGFEQLARAAMDRYRFLIARSVTYHTCKVIIALADRYKTKGKTALQVRISEEITRKGRSVGELILDDYIKTIRAIAGKGSPAKPHQSLYELLIKEKDFVRLAKEATRKYDSLSQYTKYGALDAAVTQIAIRKRSSILNTMPKGFEAVCTMLSPILRKHARRSGLSASELAEQTIIRTFTGYLFALHKRGERKDEKTVLNDSNVPVHLHSLILADFRAAKRKGHV